MSISTPKVKPVPGGPMRVATAVVAAVLALVLAGCGDDEESNTEAASPNATTEAALSLSREQTIERAGNEWAALFAAGRSRGERYQSQPLSERVTCNRHGVPIENCTPPSSEFRESFEDATVEDIAINGRKAVARFSNGETIVFLEPSGLIHKLGGNAGREFFEGAGNRRCGKYGRWRLVVEGDISCPEARRVMHGVVHNRVPSSWTCGGPDARIVCAERNGMSVVTATF